MSVMQRKIFLSFSFLFSLNIASISQIRGKNVNENNTIFSLLLVLQSRIWREWGEKRWMATRTRRRQRRLYKNVIWAHKRGEWMRRLWPTHIGCTKHNIIEKCAIKGKYSVNIVDNILLSHGLHLSIYFQFG